jgi:hypothetical protein
LFSRTLKCLFPYFTVVLSNSVVCLIWPRPTVWKGGKAGTSIHLTTVGWRNWARPKLLSKWTVAVGAMATAQLRSILTPRWRRGLARHVLSSTRGCVLRLYYAICAAHRGTMVYPPPVALGPIATDALGHGKSDPRWISPPARMAVAAMWHRRLQGADVLTPAVAAVRFPLGAILMTNCARSAPSHHRPHRSPLRG